MNNLLSKFESADVQRKLSIIEIANTRKCSDDEDLKNVLYNKVVTQLTQSNKEQQAIIQKIVNELNYLGRDRLRQMTTDIFDWIKNQTVANQYYILPIKFIFNLQQLSKEELGHIPYYLFQILRTSNDLPELEIASDMLNQLKPNYEEHQQIFNDLKNRIDPEGNLSIKNYLIAVLLKLKPSTLSEKNKEFWEQVEILHQASQQVES
ncbi:MAG: hypothetical protein L6407_03455 [Candidatus Delongbacteria bacterium]|nr:hypothetical protein [Candidatus Delongbacteria bacterium]